VRLGIGSYTYNWWAGVPGYPAPRDPLTVEKLFARARELNVDVVQIADNLPLDHNGLPSVPPGLSVEVGTRGITPGELTRYLGIARALGSPILRTLLDGPGCRPPAEDAVAMLREVLPEFERAGVVLAIENHDRFRAAELRRIVDACGSPAIGVCLDTANSLGCGEGIEQVLDAVAEVTVNLHIKDFTARRLPHGKGFVIEGTPAGQGLVDIPRVLDRLRAAGRDVNAIIELWTPPAGTVEASIKKEDIWAAESVRYMRTLIAAERSLHHEAAR
jgi:sugar phosphate isomerase/epimerase